MPFIENDLGRGACNLLEYFAELRNKLVREVVDEESAAQDDLLVDLDFYFIFQIGCEIGVELIVILVLTCVMIIVQVFLDVHLDV